MVELRCNNCLNMKNAFCSKLKEPLPNGFDKLYFCDADGIYAENVIYPSKCGIEKTTKTVNRQPEEETIFGVIEKQDQKILV